MDHTGKICSSLGFAADYLAMIIVGQWGQCTINVFQKAKTLLLCCGGKDNSSLFSGEVKQGNTHSEEY